MREVFMITHESIDALRAELERKKDNGQMSEKRFVHTVEVEKMAARIARIYAPEKELILRAAALLHDITKEFSFELQIKLCAQYGLDIGKTDYHAPKTLHARTAAEAIKEDYPEFADDEVVSCVRWHTTGREKMTLCEKIVYLADYIDMSRKFEDCVRLREYFFGKDISNMSDDEKMTHLDRTLLISFDMTISGLLEKKAPISFDTIAARNELAVKLIEHA
jgi:predicted HD superfamily hydrolase involved in NAD metabolism